MNRGYDWRLGKVRSIATDGKIIYDTALSKFRLSDALEAAYDPFIKTQLGTLLNYPPAYELATLWLDGSIVDVEGAKYFVDKKAGNNVLITGYDFPTGWVSGFPYKSAATIDVFGQTGVPVVSLFQNFDYANQYFTRHVAQVVDGNLVETSEPYVCEIVAYSEALTGTDLTSANTYYGVPVEDVNAKWVSKAGNDGTGNGSKATPWLTLSKAEATITADIDQKIYVKSGVYNETNWLASAKNAHYIGIGLTALTSTGGYTYLPRCQM